MVPTTSRQVENLMNEVEEKLFNDLVVQSGKVKGTAKPSPQPELKQKKRKRRLIGKGNVQFTDLIKISINKLPAPLPNILVTTYEPDHWAEGIRDEIPEVDAFYRPNIEHLHTLLLAWEENEPVLCYGPTGSGKTSIVRHACALTGRPFFRINGRGDMESGPIFGQPSVDVDPDTGNSVYRWNNGVFTEAALGGAVVLFDEPFITPPEISAGLNPVLEEGGKLVLTDKAGTYKDKVVTPASEFRIVYADNTGGLGDATGAFAGVQIQNTSTLDRFQTVIYMDYLSSNEEKELLERRFPGEIDDDIIDKFLQMAYFIRTSYIQGSLSFTMSPRTLISWARKYISYNDAAHALRVCFLRKFRDESEISTIERHYTTVFGDSL